MLARLIEEIRRSLGKRAMRASAADPATVQPLDLRAMLLSLLREPLAHPKSLNYESVAWIVAAARSADYMVRHMMGATNHTERMPLLEFALEQCSIQGLVMEFGVFRGESLRAIAQRVRQDVHGFDSFEGLPEDWTYYQKQGRFGLEGNAPAFPQNNIHLHKGWFDATLPGFLATSPGPARFIHIDCDLYSSTRTVLEQMSDRIVPGTVILFDEYLNYPGWDQHEFRAFQEFVQRTAMRYRYIGFASADSSVAVKMT